MVGVVHTPNQDQAHLEKQLDFGFNHVLIAVVEELGTVTCWKLDTHHRLCM